jgi:hypothetical protein
VSLLSHFHVRHTSESITVKLGIHTAVPQKLKLKVYCKLQSILQPCRISGSCNGDWRSEAFGMWGHVFWNKFALSEQHAATFFRVEAYSEVEDSRFLCNVVEFQPEYMAFFPKWQQSYYMKFWRSIHLHLQKFVCYMHSGFSFPIISVLLKLYQNYLNKPGMVPSGKQ